MTEDYKKNLINYVTNLLNEEQPQPQDFNITNINGIEYANDIWTDIINSFRLQTFVINGILENEKYDTFIMYGAYQNQTEENSKGFLIYLDKNGLPIKLEKLNSRGFVYLDFDNSTNRVYGAVSDRATSYTSADNDVYFVYYNNLFLMDDVNQTYSYRIWKKTGNTGADIFMPRNIVKDPNGSNYLIFGSSYNGLYAPKIIELKINVGSSNEITTWSVNTNYYYYSSFGYYTEGTPHFKIICLNISSTPHQFALVQDNGSSVSYTNLTTDTTIDNQQNFYVTPGFIAINQTNMYFIYNAQWIANNLMNRQSCLYHYDGTSIETIYKTPVTQVASSGSGYPIKNIPMLNIIKDTNNNLYLIEYISDEDLNTTIVKLLNLSNHSTITNDDWVTIGTYSCVYKNNIYNQKALLRRNYNIANIFIYSGYFKEQLGFPTTDTNGFQINIQNLAPINGYVGTPYTGVDVLVPKFSNLYSGESLIFSRNLYNITKQNNQTMSSVEIPNNYLNNDTITQNDLISKTNIELNNDTTNWNKNIYEVVDVNFINTISVMDEDTNTPYLESAIKLNNATTNGGNTNYENTPCTKYRINYSDNTNSIKNINWTSIDNTHKETEISLYVDKSIYSIDFISHDETTIYLTIPVEVEVGKYYTIKQKIKIE